MTNINSVEKILSSNNKGIGKTDSLPALYSLEAGTFEIKGVGKTKVSTEVIGAKFIQLFHSFIKDVDTAKKVQHLEALGKDFLTLDQLRGTTSEVKKGKAKANITSEEYKANCIKLAIDSPDVFAILSKLIDTDFEKTTKAVLAADVKELTELLFSDVQQACYQVKVDKEHAEKVRFVSLEENGFTVIDSSEKSVTVTTLLANMGSVHLLAGLGYTLTNSDINVVTGTVTLTLVVAAVPELV